MTGYLLCCGNVQSGLDGEEDRDETVAAVNIIGSLGKDGGLGVKSRPGTDGNAEIPLAGRGDQSGVFQQTVRNLPGSGGEDDGGVCGHNDLRRIDGETAQFLPGSQIAQRDHIHTAVENFGDPPAVVGIVDGADAAAVHHNTAATASGAEQRIEIEPEGAAAGYVLHERAAAVHVEFGVLHSTGKGWDVEGVYRVDPVAQAGFFWFSRHDPKGHIRVNGFQLQQDGLQNCLVACISTSVRAADDGTVPLIVGTGVMTQDNVVYLKLTLDGAGK